jgi:hypothetical protein
LIGELQIRARPCGFHAPVIEPWHSSCTPKGGDDTFVFASNNGQDKIEDLGQGVQGVSGSNWGVDHIDVTALGIHDFGQLNISAFDPNTHESTITFSPSMFPSGPTPTFNEVVVHSQVALSAHDFILAA